MPAVVAIYPVEVAYRPYPMRAIDSIDGVYLPHLFELRRKAHGRAL